MLKMKVLLYYFFKKVLLYVSRGLLLLFHKKNKAMNEREVLLEAKYMFLWNQSTVFVSRTTCQLASAVFLSH
jgi:hypothetical protein